MIEYTPYEKRTPDEQYTDLLRYIRENGKNKVPIHARLNENNKKGHHNSREVTGRMLSYDLSNGFPVLTQRDFTKIFKGAIGELIAFINGARTLEDLKKYGCPEIYWKSWVTAEKCAQFGLPEGDLGCGSYGASLESFQSRNGIEFNQVDAVLNQMKAAPFLRTHILTTWNPPHSMGDKNQGVEREVVVAPCHGNFVHFVLFDDQKELEMTHTQRSADAPVGLPINIIEWSILGLMVSHVLGYKFTKYTHFLDNPHYYDVQEDAVTELLNREPRRFPTVKIKDGVKHERLQDFRADDFELTDYEPHSFFKIDTPI
jgi:thymidylate synthase